MKKIVALVALIGVLMTGCFGPSKADNGDLHVYTIDNKDGKVTAAMIADAFKENGFVIGENADVQGGLLKMFKDDNFEIYNNISIYHSDITLKMINTHADTGVLAPIGIVVYQKKGETDLNIAFSRAQTQAKITGAKVEDLKAFETAISKVITTLLPKAKHSYNKDARPPKGKLLVKYALDIKGGDWEEAKDELEETFEEKFEEAGYVMPSYFDLTDDLGEDSPYDFFATYSICKINVIRSIAKVKPEGAAFGPCTTMVYKKKDEDKLVMGFASVYNWMSSVNIKDKESVDALLAAQEEYEGILKDVTKN